MKSTSNQRFAVLFLFTASAFERAQREALNKKSPHFRVNFSFLSDLDWIQTSNLLSRNQMRYSVAPRGLYSAANIGIID